MLFDINSYCKGLPPRTTVFASGANRASEIRAFQRLGIPIGVSVGELNEDAVTTLLAGAAPVMVDSGAFSEVTPTPQGFSVNAPITHKDWLIRLASYLRIGKGLGSLASFVVPDRVGDQALTLDRLRLYSAELKTIAATGADLLLPMQVGSLSHGEFFCEASAAAGVPLSAAFPMKKARTSTEAILHFVVEHRPAKIHLLGIGISTRRATELVKMIATTAPGCCISMDSNRLRAVTGVGRPMTQTETRLRSESPCRVFAEAESESLDLAGVRLDYTEMIARPGSWATSDVLVSMAAALRLSLVNTQLWLSDPDAFLQSPRTVGTDEPWVDDPLLQYLLDQAWMEFVCRASSSCVREAAVTATFKGALIAGQYGSKTAECGGIDEQ